MHLMQNIGSLIESWHVLCSLQGMDNKASYDNVSLSNKINICMQGLLDDGPNEALNCLNVGSRTEREEV